MEQINRMRRLSGLNEHDNDDAFMQGLDREKHIETLIRHAFDKLGLTINYNNYSVTYEDSTREASVELEDGVVDVRDLARLYESGLSHQFKVAHSTDSLRIEFTVVPELDAAQVN